MKTLVSAAVMFSVLLASSCGSPGHDNATQHGEITQYYCPMKCEGDKTYDEPGTCPVCHMDLKPVGEDSHDGHNH